MGYGYKHRESHKISLVNKLIKRVKKQEVRKLGKPSQTVCAMELGEFNASIKRCSEKILGIKDIVLALHISF